MASDDESASAPDGPKAMKPAGAAAMSSSAVREARRPVATQYPVCRQQRAPRAPRVARYITRNYDKLTA
jgi:hypothetical protein